MVFCKNERCISYYFEKFHDFVGIILLELLHSLYTATSNLFYFWNKLTAVDLARQLSLSAFFLNVLHVYEYQPDLYTWVCVIILRGTADL